MGVLAGGFYLLGKQSYIGLPGGLALTVIAGLAIALVNYRLVVRQAQRDGRSLGLDDLLYAPLVFAVTVGVVLNAEMFGLSHDRPNLRWSSGYLSLALSLLLLGIISVQQDRRHRRPTNKLNRS